MSPLPKEDYSEAPVVVGRRSARLSTSLPIILRGLDANGQAFKENTWTISVNKQGARIATFHELRIGDEVTIENPILGRTSKAHVVRVGEKRFPEDPFDVGVELNEAQNVWGVKFPPENWQRSGSVSVSVRAVEATPEAVSAPRALRLSPPATLQPAEASKPAGALSASPPAAGGGAEGAAPASLTAEAPSAVPALAEEPRQAPTGPAQPSMAAPAESQKLASLQEATKLLEEKENLLRPLRQEFDALSNSVRVSHADLEALLARFQELQRTWQAELDRTQAHMQQFSREAICSATEQAKDGLRVTVEELSSHFIEETRKRLQAEAEVVIEASSQQAKARLAALVEGHLSQTEPQLQTQQAQAAEQVSAHISRLLQTAVAEFGERLRKTADEMAAALHPEMEKSLAGLAAQFTAQVDRTFQARAQGAAETAEQSFRQNLRRMQENVQEEITGASAKARESWGQAIDAASRGAAQNAQATTETMRLAAEEGVTKLRAAQAETQSWADDMGLKFRKQVAELSTAALDTLRHYTEVQSQGLQTELQTTISRVQDKAVQDATERLQKTTRELMDSSAQLLQTQADDTLEQVADRLKTLGKDSQEEIERQLGTLAQSTRETLTQEAGLLAQGSRGELTRAAQEVQAQSLRELEAHLRQEADKQREAYLKQFQREVDQSCERGVTDLRSRVQRATLEASEKVYKHVGLVAVMMKEWADQAKLNLDACLQDAVESFEKQRAELLQEALEKHRQGSVALSEDLRSRLQQAARILRDIPPDENKTETK